MFGTSSKPVANGNLSSDDSEEDSQPHQQPSVAPQPGDFASELSKKLGVATATPPGEWQLLLCLA